MNVLRQRIHPLAVSRIGTTSLRRSIGTSSVCRFPQVTPTPTPETFSKKARPTSVHASPDSAEGRAYIPPSNPVKASSAVEKAVRESAGKAEEERFTGPARLRSRYERPKEARDLPGDISRWRYCASPYPLQPFSASTDLHYLVFVTRRSRRRGIRDHRLVVVPPACDERGTIVLFCSSSNHVST